jgi:EAL domain-containing protein (putative c-di-GMP-specific phosphodiesterase class I)
LRWQHPEHGLLTPDRFIPLAESSGVIVDIDDWVLRTACAQVSAWDLAGLAPLGMAVNVSSRRLASGGFSDAIAGALHDAAIAPQRLEVEITETAAVDNDGAAVKALTRVRELGVSVAIDDFGMGYSALSRLQAFPADRLKIDKAFVGPLGDTSARGSLVDAMISMGESLGLSVVAEGVETSEQLRALRALGCASGQGYLFGRPAPAAEIERLARTNSLLAPPESAPAARLAPAAGGERLVRSLLAELQRVTGLESTYLTRIDLARGLQRITHARNAGLIEIPEGLDIDWSDTVCRRALEQNVRYTDDVPSTFPDAEAGKDLGLQTYLSVPVLNAEGQIEGTLCGASSQAVRLGPEALRIMERFAQIMALDAQPAAGAGAPVPGPAGGGPPS